MHAAPLPSKALFNLPRLMVAVCMLHALMHPACGQCCERFPTFRASALVRASANVAFASCRLFRRCSSSISFACGQMRLHVNTHPCNTLQYCKLCHLAPDSARLIDMP